MSVHPPNPLSCPLLFLSLSLSLSVSISPLFLSLSLSLPSLPLRSPSLSLSTTRICVDAIASLPTSPLTHRHVHATLPPLPAAGIPAQSPQRPPPCPAAGLPQPRLLAG